MVCTRKPKCSIALHSSPTNESILKCKVKCVTDMQLTCNVWRRHNDCVWFFIFVNFCMEVVALHPEIINSVLKLRRFVGFSKLLCHNHISLQFIRADYPTNIPLYYRILLAICQLCRDKKSYYLQQITK